MDKVALRRAMLRFAADAAREDEQARLARLRALGIEGLRQACFGWEPAEELRADPDLLASWFAYAERRADLEGPRFTLARAEDAYVVGYAATDFRVGYQDAAEACARYVIAELSERVEDAANKRRRGPFLADGGAGQPEDAAVVAIVCRRALGTRSSIDAIQSVAPFVRERISPLPLAAYLRDHPELLDAWERYSEDQRSSPAFFLKLGDVRSTVGHIPSRLEATYDRAIDACATYAWIHALGAAHSSWLRERTPWP